MRLSRYIYKEPKTFLAIRYFRISMVVLIVLSYAKAYGQNNYLLGSLQVNNMLDNRTYPSDIGFHYASQVSLGAQVPLFVNPTTSKEQFSLEMGIGKLVNSMYFKSTKNMGSGGVVDGFLIKAEPILNIYENKSKTLVFKPASIMSCIYFPNMNLVEVYLVLIPTN